MADQLLTDMLNYGRHAALARRLRPGAWWRRIVDPGRDKALSIMETAPSTTATTPGGPGMPQTVNLPWSGTK